ncbi:MAG: hypothetical protein IPG99_02425 [Ignavibacteria bacterium]|nr:hypothetical protein [Ignavibacteria bacterium]
MKKLLLIQILRSFTKDEVIKFDEFLRSPLYNKKPNAIKFFDVLKKHAPDYSDDNVRKENVWKQLYPHKHFNGGVLKNLILDLTKLSEKFIEVMQFENSFPENRFLYLDALSKRNIHSKFFSECHSLLKKFEKSKFYQNYYSDIERLKSMKLVHCNTNTNYRSEISSDQINISDYYISDVIVQSSNHHEYIVNCSIALNMSGGKSAFELILGNIDLIEILKKSDALTEKDLSILQLYYYKYLAFAFPENTDNYFNFKNALLKHSGLFSQNEKMNFYMSLALALNARPSTKDSNRTVEFLELYKLRIDEGVFTELDGTMNIYTYTNIIKMAARYSDHKLIEFVRDNFFELLLPEFKENMTYYTDAHYYYSTGEFEKALNSSLTLKLDHFAFKFDIKDLLTMIYYELGDYDGFMYHFDSYKHFLKKNKSVSANYRKWYEMFNVGVHRLLKIKLNFDEYELNKLEQDVHDGKTGSKDWFMERINKLRKSNRGK